MYHVDHNPAHFHVEYQGHEALVAIETGEILAGKLPGRALLGALCRPNGLEFSARSLHEKLKQSGTLRRHVAA